MRVIAFYTELSKKLGRGHLIRTISLLNFFKEKNQKCVLFIEGDLDNFELDQTITVKKIKWRSGYKNIEWKYHNDNFDILIFDSLLIKQNFVNKIQSSIINKKVFIDDYQRNIYFDCYIIDWTANAEKKYHIDNRKNNYMMLGLDYIVLRPDFYTKQKSLNIESNSCCVILGGTDSANILEFLDLKLFPEFTDIKFNIVNAKNAKLTSHNTQKFDWLEPKKLIKIFTSSKFVISAAGQSLYELMVLNKTTFPIIVANNQLDDINNLLEIGFLKSFYDINNKSWINNLIKDITLFNESKLDQNPIVSTFSDGRLNIFNSIIND